jgi:diguanylate cyclase (GGDEF)-like protein
MGPASIVSQAAAKSRKAIAFALIGAALIAAALIAERAVYQSEQSHARADLLAAHGAIGMLIYNDEKMTSSANLAVATGEPRWIERYDEAVRDIDATLETALAMAPTDVADELRRDTFSVNDEIQAMEQHAFTAARAGDLEGAQVILDSPEYAQRKATLAAAGGRLLTEVIGRVEKAIADRDSRATVTLLAIIAIALVGGVLLWRYLVTTLTRSESALSEAETKIRQLADTDMLTGLANRRAFVEEIKRAVERAQTNGRTAAALMVDLDRFKPINDRYGHVTGDLVLKEIASRISDSLRASDFAARIGGDEFIVLAELPPGREGEEEARRIAERIIESLSRTVVVDGLSVRLGASAGIACCPGHTGNPQELLRMADVALYRAKAEGRGRAVIYDRIMDVDLDLRAQLEEGLVLAIRAGEIVPFFQPLVDLKTGRTIAFEVLSRWNHPERGLLEPGEFIPMMEHFGLINDLTFSVLKAACTVARDMPGDIRIAVNISPQQIEDEWLAEKIMAALVETGFPPSRLEIELTETALVNDLAAAERVITSLKNLGMSVALDDFGTGYSSLCYLSELPFDKIKIDRSFVSSMRERPESAKIVSAIIGLGKSLGVQVVAEGVEEEADAAKLCELGCYAAQGWLYAKALPPEEAVAWVTPDPEAIETLRTRTA